MRAPDQEACEARSWRPTTAQRMVSATVARLALVDDCALDAMRCDARHVKPSQAKTRQDNEAPGLSYVKLRLRLGLRLRVRCRSERAGCLPALLSVCDSTCLPAYLPTCLPAAADGMGCDGSHPDTCAAACAMRCDVDPGSALCRSTRTRTTIHSLSDCTLTAHTGAHEMREDEMR